MQTTTNKMTLISSLINIKEIIQVKSADIYLKIDKVKHIKLIIGHTIKYGK